LTYRDLEEIMAERNLSVDHVTIWRWVQRYAPVLNQRIRREMRRPNRSWQVDETYIKVAGNWTYLDRAVDCPLHPSQRPPRQSRSHQSSSRERWRSTDISG
jgi:transposase-like protein